MSLWASTTAPKVPLDAADGDEAEPVRARFRERVSSPCGEDGEVETAGHPLGGGGCAALFPSSRCIFPTNFSKFVCAKRVAMQRGGETIRYMLSV